MKEAAVEAKRREAESQEHLAAARDAMERQHELQAEPPPPSLLLLLPVSLLYTPSVDKS